MLKLIEVVVNKITVGERGFKNKALELKVELDNGYILETKGNDIGTYKDDNVGKLEKILKVGKKIDVIEGELGFAVNTDINRKSYYADSCLVLPDNTKVYEK